MAFEHYNSGRSHVFDRAFFGGNFSATNNIVTSLTGSNYPTIYNVAYLDANSMFVYGGAYGNIPGNIGPYVAKVNPATLKPVWYTQLLTNSTDGNEWDYPGVLAAMKDGKLYVISGYRLWKLDPKNGSIIDTLVLPTCHPGTATNEYNAPSNTSFNGFNATSDGTIVAKSLYRAAGLTNQGPSALGATNANTTNIPPSILVSIDPKSMRVLDTITLPETVGARPTITTYNGYDFVYMIGSTTNGEMNTFRYLVYKGKFFLDPNWNGDNVSLKGQTYPTSFGVMNDWVVFAVNSLKSTVPMNVIAISQADSSVQCTIQPFVSDPLLYNFTNSQGATNVSWVTAAVSVDSANNMVYCFDAIPGQLAALQLITNNPTNPQLQIFWKAEQTTTEFTTLIGPTNARVLVSSDIPINQVPGANSNDYVIWRNAATGTELACSPILPAITFGTMIPPYYNGDLMYPGYTNGNLIRLHPLPRATPTPRR